MKIVDYLKEQERAHLDDEKFCVWLKRREDEVKKDLSNILYLKKADTESIVINGYLGFLINNDDVPTNEMIGNISCKVLFDAFAHSVLTYVENRYIVEFKEWN